VSLHRSLRSFRDVLYLLDRIASVVSTLSARCITTSIRSSVGRFCAVISRSLVPLSVSCQNDLFLRASLEPNTVLYIHENYVIMSQVHGDAGTLFRALIFGDRVPAIDLSSCDERVLGVLAASIADAVKNTRREHEIVHTLPSNLRALVERSLKLLEEKSSVGNLISTVVTVSRGGERKFIELKLWSCRHERGPSIDMPYEISYVKSIGVGYLKLRFLGAEVDIKPTTPQVAESIIARLASREIVDKAIMNVMRAAKILEVGLELGS